MSTTEDSAAAVTGPALDYADITLNQSGKMTRFRWVVLGLVFLAVTINFLDRMVMSVLAPDLQRIFHISKTEYGYISAAFAMPYALSQVISGGIVDKIGVRLGYTLSIALWSLCAVLHGVAGSVTGFSFARGALGIAEAPAFPAATKTLAEWFPKKERAFAFGFVNGGTNMGAMLAPLIVPILAGQGAVHWQWAFYVSGGIGFLWLLLWLPLYRPPEKHPRVSPAELAYIQSDPKEPTQKVPWPLLITYPQAWAFAAGKFLTDSMWWFYITWFPNFLHDRHGVDLMHMMIPLFLVYLMADVGSISGGWISSAMMKSGSSVNVARKSALLIPSVLIVPIIFAQYASSTWSAVLLMGLATACHQSFSTNLYTLVSDMFPKRAVASIAGFGGMCGYGGAALFQPIVGHLVEKENNYFIPFFCAGTAYLAALGVIHLLAPRMSPAIIDEEPRGFAVMPVDSSKES